MFKHVYNFIDSFEIVEHCQLQFLSQTVQHYQLHLFSTVSCQLHIIRGNTGFYTGTPASTGTTQGYRKQRVREMRVWKACEPIPTLKSMHLCVP